MISGHLITKLRRNQTYLYALLQLGIDLARGCPAGENANADLVAATVKLRRRQDGGEEEQQTLSLMIKLNKRDENSFEHLIDAYDREKG